MNAYQDLQDLVTSFHRGSPRGIYSVCSSHPSVIAATLKNTKKRGTSVLVESTSNQVNQFGGYTGMTPVDFFRWIRDQQRTIGLDEGSVLIGGDHVGPFPWRAEPAAAAMEKARGLVQACVMAGYTKIHLDATMCLADDEGDRARRLDPRVSAARTAELCRVAESAWQELRAARLDARPPLYVIGSDVPLPGGTPSGAIAPEITRVDDLQETIALCESAFKKEGLTDAWDRVFAVVVQPAVEHGAQVIHPYVREKVKPLSEALRKMKNVVFEAHATDYQTVTALREMVEDGFEILKVGPSLTSAMREALFLLTHVEEVMAPLAGVRASNVPQALDASMEADPKHWKAYYTGGQETIAFSRLYGLSDRCRYYWNAPAVESAVRSLKTNLRASGIPPSLLSQYFPRQYPLVREGIISSDPDVLIETQITEVLRMYETAVSPAKRRA